jgi:hypothetical protein
VKKVSVKSASRVKGGPTSSPQTPVMAVGQSEDDAFHEIHARISVLAYSLYEQRGRGDGHHMEDWLAAEQRILASTREGVWVRKDSGSTERPAQPSVQVQH